MTITTRSQTEQNASYKQTDMTITTRSQSKQNASYQHTELVDKETVPAKKELPAKVRKTQPAPKEEKISYCDEHEIFLNGLRCDLEERVNRAVHHHQRVIATNNLNNFNDKYYPYNRRNNAFM